MTHTSEQLAAQFIDFIDTHADSTPSPYRQTKGVSRYGRRIIQGEVGLLPVDAVIFEFCDELTPLRYHAVHFVVGQGYDRSILYGTDEFATTGFFVQNSMYEFRGADRQRSEAESYATHVLRQLENLDQEGRLFDSRLALPQ